MRSFLLALLALGLSPALRAQDTDDFFVPAAMAEMNADVAHVGDVLRAEALDWADTPHVLGGDSRRGIDCSALMQRWFGRLFGISLPRTSGEQFNTGAPVERAALRPGDLVFFGSKRRITHVGVYVGDDEFAHVASSVGVTVSSLHETYWKRRYQGARRVLESDAAVEFGTFASAAETPVVRPRPSADGVPTAAAPTFTRGSVQQSGTATSARRVGW